MKTLAEKKDSIIRKLNQLQDDDVVDELYSILYPEHTITAVDLESLPNDLQSKIVRALSDYETGNYITNLEMKDKVSEWLRK